MSTNSSPMRASRLDLGDTENPGLINNQINLAESTGMKGNAFAQVDYVSVQSKLEDKPVLLHNMTVLFPESKVTAILGPSGSGKSTLLNFVTGTLQKGLEAEGMVQLSGRMGFVPQDDRLHGFYTCRSYAEHYSRLTGAADNFANVKHSMDLLVNLGMDSHADTIVGDMFRKGLSGGQKKRLSIALEALSSPETLFLDEPTSGLDAESAYQVMKFLTNYAKGSGRRVIITIHQPSSFIWKMLDNVVLLSKGKLMYQGRRSKIEQFFTKYGYPCPKKFNPADHYVSLINDDFVLHEKSVDEWAAHFEEWQEDQTLNNDLQSAVVVRNSIPQSPSDASTGIMTTVLPSSRGSTPVVIFELTRRYLWNLICNPGIIFTRVVMYSMLSLMIGILFFNLEDKNSHTSVMSRIALLFYSVAFFVFMSVAAVPFAVIERGIVEKEVRNGYYHPACFQLAQAIASIPGTLGLAVISSAITLAMTDLRNFTPYFLNMFLSLNCAEALAQLASHIVPHYIIGISLIAGVYGMFMLLQGFMLVPSEFPSWLEWLHYVPFHTYSWRSFMDNEFGGDNITFDSQEFPTGQAVLEQYEIGNVNQTNDMIVLVGYSVFIHLLSFAVLHLKYVRHKKNQVTIEGP